MGSRRVAIVSENRKQIELSKYYQIEKIISHPDLFGVFHENNLSCLSRSLKLFDFRSYFLKPINIRSSVTNILYNVSGKQTKNLFAKKNLSLNSKSIKLFHTRSHSERKKSTKLSIIRSYFTVIQKFDVWAYSELFRGTKFIMEQEIDMLFDIRSPSEEDFLAFGVNRFFLMKQISQCI